jgi:hypothetical protein
VIHCLPSPASGFVAGKVLMIDGGLAATLEPSIAEPN